jgi:3-dehydroquinate dehydratase-1
MEPQTTKRPLDPLVLGVVTAEMLRARAWPEALWTCGGVELRADGLEPEAIPAAVADFAEEKHRRGFGGPTVFTLRLERDGGAWKDAEAGAREAVWRSLPVGACDLADLEVEEIDSIDAGTVRLLRDLGAAILLSHHAFAPEAPSRWTELFETMRVHSPDGVKFAVLTPDRASAEALLRLAREVAAHYPVSCVMGMGAEGALTRLVSPLLGCPLTYGYLGDAPVAPGQLPAAGMRAFFERARPAAAAASEAERLDHARAEWERLTRA